MNLQKPKGTLDILPEDVHKRIYVENTVRRICSYFNYDEIRTPTFEKTTLFERGIGEATDIVSKEMYSFNEREFTLKPEMTAPVIRAYLENGLCNKSPLTKLFYIANMFRHERPQAGRFREFEQYGVEAIGSNDFTIDAEMIYLGVAILKEFGIINVITKINTIGKPGERQKFTDNLKVYLQKYHNDLSADSKKRLELNPLRILDTKDGKEKEILKGAPRLYDFLEDDTKSHFSSVTGLLKDMDVAFEVDYNLVRGFDYYTSTTFEVISDDLGSQNAVFGGGRYDLLVEQLGGKPTPAIGFACGIERLMMILEKNNFSYPEKEGLKFYFICLGEEAKRKGLQITLELRKRNIKGDMDFLNRSIKSQMKEANKLNAKYVIILGENEIAGKLLKVKKMSDGTEFDIPFDNIEELIEKIII